MSERARAHALISGLVQGVNFRWETKRTADRLGVGGWVRNRSDGTVEAVFEGTRPAVEETLDWCRRGPRRAVVDHVTVSWEQPRGDAREFSIRLT
jgi:acylphosphatase